MKNEWGYLTDNEIEKALGDNYIQYTAIQKRHLIINIIFAVLGGHQNVCEHFQGVITAARDLGLISSQNDVLTKATKFLEKSYSEGYLLLSVPETTM